MITIIPYTKSLCGKFNEHFFPLLRNGDIDVKDPQQITHLFRRIEQIYIVWKISQQFPNSIYGPIRMNLTIYGHLIFGHSRIWVHLD